VIQVVGYLGSAGAAVMWVPQAVRAYVHRHDSPTLAGISSASYLAAVVFNALLLAYGLLNRSGPVVLAGCVNFVCATVIVTVLLSARTPET